jgi:hypothetical protein
MRRAAAVAALVCAALMVGCGTKSPDYQSIWTPSTTATTPMEAIPISQYLEREGVAGEAVAPGTLTDLTVSMPTPPGWSKRTNPKLPSTTEVIGKGGGKYPTAILTVFKLNGDFEAGELVKDSFADAALAPNFKQLDSSVADYHGFPSAMIQGSHDLEGQRVHSWYRMVVATGSPPGNQHYLVQLTIFALADQAAKQAADVETIINGFTVAAK